MSELEALAGLLHAGVPREMGILNGRRYFYSSVDAAVSWLTSADAPAAVSAHLKRRDAHSARSVLQSMLRDGLIGRVALHVDTVHHPAHDGQPASVTRRAYLSRQDGAQLAAGDNFVWYYEGSVRRRWALLGDIVAIVLAGLLMPFWPQAARTGLMYVLLALALLILLVMFIVRPVAYYATKAVYKTHAWSLFPNADNDKIGLLASFRPVHEWQAIEQEKKD